MEGSFRPLSRGSFFNDGDFALMAWVHEFSSPFLGTFFQWDDLNKGLIQFGFRPLSWGLSFNTLEERKEMTVELFSSPFLGTFFQYAEHRNDNKTLHVFVPFLGDFFSINCR